MSHKGVASRVSVSPRVDLAWFTASSYNPHQENGEPSQLNMRITDRGRELVTAGDKDLPERSPGEREMCLGGFSVRSDNVW
jgi:hypothetical protein